MKRILLTFLCLQISFIGLMSQTYRWKGGSGNFSDPSNWEPISFSEIEKGVFNPQQSTFIVDTRDAKVVVDQSITLQTLVWKQGIISGDKSKVIRINADLKIEDDITDQFLGQWQLASDKNLNLNLPKNITGSFALDISGKIEISGSTEFGGDFIIRKGDISINNSKIICNSFVLEGEESQNIYLNTTTILFNHFKSQNNPNRRIYYNNSRFEKIRINSGSKALTVTSQLKHYCDNTLAQVTITANNAAKIYVHYQVDFYDEFGTLVSSQTYRPLSTNSSRTFSYNFGTSAVGYVDWSVSVYNNATYTGAPLESEAGFEQFDNVGFITINNITVDDVTTAGGNDGKITVNASGGVSPLTYTLASPMFTNNTGVFNNLYAGFYNLTISNSNLSTCPDVTQNNIEVKEPTASFTIVSVTSTDETPCSNSNNGTITFTVSNPVGTPQFSIDGGSNWSTDNVFNNLTAGTYNCQAKDNDTTLVWGDVSITQPDDITITNIDVTHVSTQGGNDGRIQVTATGPNSPLTFTLTGGPTNNTGDFQNLIAGEYFVTVSDGVGCPVAVSSSIMVNQPTPGPFTHDSTFVRPVTCRNDADAIVRLYVSGGKILPYEYRMSSPAPGTGWQSSNEFSNLSPGSYEFEMRDATGIPVLESGKVNIINPEQLVISDIDVINITTCYNDSTGQITITASGGHAPLQYSIDNGATWSNDHVFTNLGVGEYNIWVKDNYGCQVYWGNENISGPAPLVINNVTKTDITTCYEATTGSITISASGGTGTIRYSINGVNYYNNGGVFTNLGVGTYPVSVRDANGCITSYGNVIISAPPQLTYSVAKQDVTGCNGDINGSITITASGGTGTLYYSINGGINWFLTNTFTNLSANSYEVRVRDDNNCTKGETVIISQPAVIAITNESYTQITCNNANNGTITITATGGTAPLTYTITGGGSNQTGVFTGLSAGTYQVTVNDANGCPPAISSAITIVNPGVITITNESYTQITCNNANNGSITITATGGTAPLTYTITGGSSNQTGSFTGLSAGNYQVTVTDVNGCPAAVSSMITIINPAPISITNQSSTNITCNGANNGTITITAIGGTAPLTYTITGGSSNQTGVFTGLSAGTYTVTVTDANNCSPAISSPITITNPPALLITSESYTNITCNGANNGSVTVSATGGTGTLTYTITGGASNQTGVFSNLSAGNYQVTVSDVNGCSVTSSIFNITNPAGITITNESYTNITCNGANDGTITITATGGTAPLTYTITGGSSNQTGSFTGLSAGNYQVTVTDVNGCPAAVSSLITIINPAPISITNQSSTNITCNGANNGTITITATGGTAPLTYTITGGSSNQTGVFTGLSAGTYQVTVSDVNGCPTAVSTPITIINPAPISITNESYTQITCNNANNGTITITATGGTAPLTYTITGGSSNQTGVFTGLSAGTYQVTVSDVNGCPTAVSSAITIVNPAAITITNESYTNLTCSGSNNGTITITATGGTAPLTYTITGGSSNQTGVFTGLSAGTYQVTVSDANGCPSAISSNITITSPSPITITNQSSTNITCNGANNGTITITATGGTAPLTYTITGGSSNQTGVFTGLSAGTYQVTVSDVNGCPTAVSTPITIINPAPISITNESYTQITCNNANNGTITITATGGTAPLTYTITGGSSNQTGVFTGLSAGTYQVTVSDVNGCPTAVSSAITIVNPAAITITNESYTNLTCSGSNNGTITITATGGTAPLTYTITGGSSNQTGVFTGLSAGTYQVTVSDANGCPSAISSNITITSPSPITITNQSSTNITCNGANNGTITITATGGTAPLTYTITGGSSNQTGVFTGLSAGTYQVTVSDVNGCPTAVSTPITIINPAPISITNESYTQITCNNANNGTITITATGGTAPLTYTITGGSSNQTGVFTGLSAGTYQVTVSDVNGCPTVVSSAITIVNPAAITITNESYTNLTCSGSNNGTITITATGGTAPLTYTITGGSSNQTGVFTGLSAGTYQVTVSDANGCPSAISSNITITSPSPITITNQSSTNITCNGANNGTITITATGGTAPLTYTITGGSSNQTGVFTGLSAGTYQVSVSDVNGCGPVQSTAITIIEPSPLVFSGTPTVNNITCFGANNGSIFVKVTGGVTPYTYSINGGYPSNNTGDFYGLAAGTYQVTVIDANGCGPLVTAPLVLTEPAAISINSINKTDITCNNANNGTITISASGGTGTLVYTLTGGAFNNTGLFTGLAAGNYQVSVTDQNSCGPVISSLITIVNPPAIIITSENVVNLPCNGSGNVGQVSVVATGGTGNLTYDIGNGSPQVNNGTFTGLAPGSYQVTITDNNGCSKTSSTLTVIEPSPIIVTLTDSALSCGSLPIVEADQIFLPDGTGVTYTSTIHHTDFAPGATVQSVNDIESIAINIEHSYAGDLTIRLECPNGNQLLLSDRKGGGKFLGEPVRDPSDSDLQPGVGYTYIFRKDATYTWQTVPLATYTYTDLGGNLHTNKSYIPAGNYLPAGSFTSMVGCPLNGDWKLHVTDNFPIDNGYLFKWYLNFAPSTFPEGYCNGSATVAATGGSGNFTYLWSTGANTTTITNLCADTYYVTVTDQNNCSVIHEVVIQDVNIQMNIDNITHVQCAGVPNGAVTISATGGNAPYTYSWNTGATGPTLTNLAGGWYYVTITDNNLCQKFDSVQIQILNQISVTFSNIVPTSCNIGNGGNHTGSAMATASGGVGSYQYQWASGETTQTAVNLTAGWNRITVTDDVNCVKIDSVFIPEPTLLTISNITITPPTCHGNNNGQVQVTVSGGTGSPVINWYTTENQFVSSGSPLVASAGSYILRVSDQNSCTIPDSVINMTEPQPIDFNVVTTNSACNVATGTAEVQNITGGNGGYTVRWFNSANVELGTGANITSLSIGDYTVRVEDLNGCFAVKPFTIQSSSDLQITAINWITPVGCFGSCNGTAQIQVSSTIPIVGYVWSTGSTTNTQAGLCGGSTVSVTVTDQNGCTKDTTFTVPQPEQLSLTITPTHETCSGANNGAAVASVLGGTIPYNYHWENSNGVTISSNNQISDLSPGTYYLTVTDANNCQITDSVIINSGTTLSVTATITPAACGQSNGSATLNVSNGIMPITYIWPAPMGATTNPTMNGLGVGIYTVTVVDGTNCQTTYQVVMIDQSNIAIHVESITNATCFNGTNGSATISVTGGTGLIDIIWRDVNNNIVGANFTADNLIGGQYYYVTATDEAGCSRVEEIYIGQPSQIVISINSQSDATCFGALDGQVLLSATGGNGAPYSYLWPDNQNTNSRHDLAAGNYLVTVSDALSCSEIVSITIGQPSQITYNLTVVQPDCGQINGSISVSNISGGSGAGYVVTWSHLGWSVDSVGVSISNLEAGSYFLNITDNTSCSVTEQINLSDNTTLAANTVSITNVTCAGSTTGSATIEVTGGVMPYTIVWNNGQTGNTISNVGAGNYTATITDAQNCTIFYTVTINENPPIVSTFVFTQPIQCAEYPYATFHVDVTGGVQPYSFEWRNQANQVLGTSAELQNMGGGRYYIQITDALGCQKLDSVDVIVPNPIQIAFNTTQTDCATPTGTVTAIVEGGATPYAYQWANFENPSMIITGNGTATITNLPAGYYVLTLTDALGCQKTDTAQVESNTNMVLNISNVQSVTCLGRNDGMATLTIENGNEPFTVIWANGDTLYNQTNRIITNTQLYQGTQIVKVIDNSGCVQTRMFTVPTGGALYVVMYSYPDVGGDVADFGIARADALGGVQPYSYQWKNAAGVVVGNTAQINNLNYGWYFVTVTDSNTPSCQWIDSVEVVPSVISYDTLYINHVTCYEYNNGAISVQAKGGEAPYTYRWRHSSWTQDSLGNTITNLIAGIYQLTITDVYGFAPLVTSIEIRQPASMGITLHIVEQTECTIPTGKLQVNFNPIYTPVTPMTYAWAHPGWSSYPAPDSIFVDQNTLNNIGIGWYYVTITDGNGCAETDSVYMTDNSPLALRLSVIHPTCYGLSTGRITAIVTDAIGTVTYSWSHNPTLDSNIAANLAAGHYGLTITDGSSSCQRMADTTLVQPDELIFSILDTIRPTCYNDQNGSIVTQINGGTQPYSLYVINQATGQPTQVPGNTIANISAGTYLIRVVDGNNCVTNYQPVNLRSEAPYMDVSILIDNNPTCNVNSEDGILKATVVAGDHPNLPWVNQPDPSQYTYLWSNGQTLQSATVGMGYYDVTVAYAPYPQCTATNSILVDMAHNNIYPNASLDPLAGITKDSTVCVGDTIAVYSYYNIYGLDGIGRNADSIRWISQNPILVRPITDTIEYYTITSSNTDRNKFYVTVYSNGCSNVDSLTVRTFNLPEVEASAFKIDRTLGSDFEGTEPLRSIFVGNDALIKVTRPVTDSTTYQWSEQYYTTVQGLPTTNSIIAHTNDWTRIVVRPIDSTIYTVRAKTKAYPQRQHYCYSSDTVLVRVLGQFNPPTAFSPNGDGHNDFWKLEGIDQFTSFNVQIFNRWGQQVFESNDINFRWDGTNKKGKELPVGTYYYIIQYTTDSGTKKISGPVTIVR